MDQAPNGADLFTDFVDHGLQSLRGPHVCRTVEHLGSGGPHLRQVLKHLPVGDNGPVLLADSFRRGLSPELFEHGTFEFGFA